MLPKVLATLVAGAGVVSACTFAIEVYQSTVNNGGSSVVKCEFRAYDDDGIDFYNTEPGWYTEIECGGGCTTLDVNGLDWEACIDRMSDLDLTGTAIVSSVATKYRHLPRWAVYLDY